MDNKIYDVAIIGGSVAGLTAAIYTGRKKLQTVVITPKIGGQNLSTGTVENYPGLANASGPEITDKIFGQVKEIDSVEIKEGAYAEKVEKKEGVFEIKLSTGGSISSKAVIVATGRTPRSLEVPGEKEFFGKGVSTCSICDAPLFGGMDVAVVGSGNSGLESVLDLLSYANKIYLLDSSGKMRGDEVMQDKIKKSGKVEIITGVEIVEVKGSKMVDGLVYKEIDSGKTTEIKIGGVFVHVGWMPNSGFMADFVKLNGKGEIVVNNKGETSEPGVFAAGDITDVKYKQLIVAAGEGAIAALSAHEYLTSHK